MNSVLWVAKMSKRIMFTNTNMLVFFVFTFTVFLYQPLVKVLPGYKFIDEAVVLMLAGMAVFKFMFLQAKFPLLPEERAILFFWTALILIGLLSSALSQLQPLRFVLMDFLLLSKFLIAYFSVRILIRCGGNEYVLSSAYRSWYLAFLVLLVVLVIIGKLFYVFPVFDYRFGGIPSTQLFYVHPARYGFVFACLFVVLLPMVRQSKWWIICLIVILLLGGLSLRYKFFLFVFVALFTIYLLSSRQRKKFFSLRGRVLIFIVILAMVFVGYGQFNVHFMPGEGGAVYPRGLMLITGVEIAKSYFPLGAGFGSFGGYVSSVNYSDLYHQYGLSVIQGLSPDKTSFLADNFLALLVGQFGFVGLFCFFGTVINFYKILGKVYYSSVSSWEYPVSGLLILTVVVIDSAGETIFMQNRAVFAFVFIACVVSKRELVLRRAGGQV